MVDLARRIWHWLIHGPAPRRNPALDLDEPGAPPGYLLDRNDWRTPHSCRTPDTSPTDDPKTHLDPQP